MKEINKYKQQNGQRQEQLQQTELTFRHQIAVHENNAQDNWIKPRIWEREMAEQSREVASLKHRQDGMEGKRLLEGYRRRRPMPGSPEMQNPPRRGKGHVMMCSSLISVAKPFPVGDHRVSWTESQLRPGTAGGLKG
ncbi:transport and Golgi organization protein 1 homolog isoform X2 [Panthera pardus]|uniref:Transport and Golgi organization protein 1 homolog isoform X2 n=1 Tax=Panthera pardus TaxID=9691 RepID=A0A9W2V781_PANPR|nr:transport and Golgi organization protein 1 homolog isoform X2 [Panthera pardus]XP_053754355.1 transport and Golgi organization protein 1 homolog isoform X2 [Panthera pardus]